MKIFHWRGGAVMAAKSEGDKVIVLNWSRQERSGT